MKFNITCREKYQDVQFDIDTDDLELVSRMIKEVRQAIIDGTDDLDQGKESKVAPVQRIGKATEKQIAQIRKNGKYYDLNSIDWENLTNEEASKIIDIQFERIYGK